MKILTTAILLITLQPAFAYSQPMALTTYITKYCLPGRPTASGEIVFERCIALSRKLKKDLKADFGDIIEIEGHGRFVFADLMPPQHRYYKVDIYDPVLKRAKVFGIKKGQIKVVRKVGIKRDKDGDYLTAVRYGRKLLASEEKQKNKIP